MKLYNTLTRTIEEFVPINPPNVGMYVCGPTVYDLTHIGHMRTYTNSDVLRRALKYNGFEVKMVMNITDVGHLTGDRDMGEDKLEKKAREESKNIWEVAKFYTEKFYETMRAINVLPPDVECKATDHIAEQIALIKRLEEKGFTYKTSDGVYFDTAKLADYGKLAHLDLLGLQEGARVEKNPEKKNSTDFALWKFSYPKGRSFDSAQDDVASRRQMEWESPWGMGFPGWHIECSAMSMKYLGEQFDPFGRLRVNGEQGRTIDIHTGGVDHIAVHHTNEIAQAEAATGKVPFVKYWFHSNFLLVNGEKMSKSQGNFYTLKDITDKGLDPVAARYWFLNGHYRSEMNFTWEGLQGAATALKRLQEIVVSSRQEAGRTALSADKLAKVDDLRYKFAAAVDDDLKMPEAVAVVWEVAKSNIPGQDKYDLLVEFDKVLGLGLDKLKVKSEKLKIGEEIQELVNQREALRQEGKFEEADGVRADIQAKGYDVEDTATGPKIKKISNF